MRSEKERHLAATVVVAPDLAQFHNQSAQFEQWLSSVEARRAEAQGDPEKLKVGTVLGCFNLLPHCYMK